MRKAGRSVPLCAECGAFAARGEEGEDGKWRCETCADELESKEPDMETKRQHLVALTVKNFKRLVAVELKPGPNGVLILTGANEQGKSSTLDAISAALQGKRFSSKAPVHKGADRAEIILETEDLVVTRTFTAKGGGSITVKDREGRSYSSPQALLDKLCVSIGFDPLSFARMSEKDRLAKLLEICPVNIDLEESQVEEKAAVENRRIIGIDLKRARAALAEAPLVEGAPKQEVSVGALSDEMAGLQEQRRTRNTRVDSIETAEDRIREWGAEIARLDDLRKAMVINHETACAELDAAGDPAEDIARVREAIDTAEGQNALYRQAEARGNAIERVTQTEKRHKKADRRVDKIRTERADALKRAEFPVETLEISDDSTVMYEGLPFSEAATSGQIKVGIRLAVHASPKLRLAFVREASLLDAKSMATMDEEARANDLLVLMERVEDDSPAAIEIVDGCTAGGGDPE